MTTPVETTPQLTALRKLMQQRNLDAYLVPGEDAHQSEYVAECDKRRQFISGFSGSSGFAVVTLTEALLFTDGRYWLQASQELDNNWTLMKAGLPSVKTREEWLASNCRAGGKIGVDARLLPLSVAGQLKKGLKAGGQELVAEVENLVDLVWTDRPAEPANKVIVLPDSYTGVTVQAKLAQLREDLAAHNAIGLLVTALDDVAWLFNLRGNDIDYNPVFFSYAFVGLNSVQLYLNESKYDDKIKSHLGDSVQLRPYSAVFDDMKALAALNVTTVNEQDSGKSAASPKVLVSRSCSIALCQALRGLQIEDVISPVTFRKSLKNEQELEGMRNAHKRDAAALCQYFAWLQKEVVENGNKVDEISAATKAEEFRSKQKDFVNLSFPTISASGPHGAIIHYHPAESTCAPITQNALYLCDSGAQFLDGTTDVTRTIHLGTPTQREKECFTHVLKAHIALAACKFPNGISGFQLDIVARLPLWQQGLDYRHGTGHGVGAFLNVHEGPHGIGTRVALNEIPLRASMTVTNEPGYYEDGAFGIRIENVMVIQREPLSNNFGDVGFLGFETITLVPIQTSLIDHSLLTVLERQWLNEYHQQCRDKVGPLLEPGSDAHKWLFSSTEAI